MSLTAIAEANDTVGCVTVQESARRTRTWWKRAAIAATFLGLSAVVFLERLHTYNEPLERDITTYAVIAHEIIEGKTLYSDVWDHKPPAIHMTYAAAELVAGYGRNALLLMNVAAAVVSLIACYFIGSAITGKPAVGIFAAAVWAIISGNLGLEANQPNTETFINPLLLSAFAVLIRMPNRGRSFAPAIVAGLLFAFASVYKQIVVLPAALLSLGHILSCERTRRKQAIWEVAIIGGIGAIAWMIVFGYFILSARGTAFNDAVFVFNRDYAGDFIPNLKRSFTKPHLIFETLLMLSILATVTVVGAVRGFVSGPRRPWLLLGAFVVATHFAVLLPGQFFAHYYQLWLPPLVIGTAWSLSLLTQIRPPHGNLAATIVMAVILVALAVLEIPAYRLPAHLWSIRKYGPVFVQSEVVARQLDSLLRDGETFYEWGGETNLYFTTKRDPVTGLFFSEPLLTSGLRGQLWRRVAADLDRAKPDVVVLEADAVARTPPAHPILHWVNDNYRAISRNGLFLVLARKGSRIDQISPKMHRAVAPTADPVASSGAPAL